MSHPNSCISSLSFQVFHSKRLMGISSVVGTSNCLDFSKKISCLLGSNSDLLEVASDLLKKLTSSFCLTPSSLWGGSTMIVGAYLASASSLESAESKRALPPWRATK